MPLTRLERARCIQREILSLLCLPIPPQRRIDYYTTFCTECQAQERSCFRRREMGKWGKNHAFCESSIFPHFS